MVLNLYIAIPAADARTSYLQEIETAHALLALLLLATAGILLLQAIALRDMAVIAPVASGLTALLGAFAARAREVFVRNGESSTSLSMAILTCAAPLSYICLQAIIIWQRPPAREGRRGPRPPGRRGTPPSG